MANAYCLWHRSNFPMRWNPPSCPLLHPHHFSSPLTVASPFWPTIPQEAPVPLNQYPRESTYVANVNSFCHTLSGAILLYLFLLLLLLFLPRPSYFQPRQRRLCPGLKRYLCHINRLSPLYAPAYDYGSPTECVSDVALKSIRQSSQLDPPRSFSHYYYYYYYY